MSITVKDPTSYKPNESHISLILLRARGLCEDVRDELELIDPDDNERCLVVSNFADAIEEFLEGAKRLGGTP